MSTANLATINAQGVQDPPEVTASSVARVLGGVTVAFLQEVGNLRGRYLLRRMLSTLLGVWQSADTAATAGSAVVWDRSRCTAGRRGKHIGVRPGRFKLRTRWVVWVDLTIDHDLTIRAMACHRPPRRYRALWPAFDSLLTGLVAASPHPVVIGMDANADQVLIRGTRWVGFGIDGLLVDRGLMVGPPAHLPRTDSDHRGVTVPLAVGTSW